MTGPLTQAEAETRARVVTAIDTSIELDLTATDAFTSTTTLTFDAHAGSATFIECQGRLLDARLNGVDLDIAEHDGRRLPLRNLQEHNELVVCAAMEYSHDGEGLHEHIDAADGARYLYATSFLDAAPRWFACFDQPDLKTRLALRVICPGEWVVLGNARCRAVETRPDGSAVWESEQTPLLSTYLVTVVAGDYVSHHRDHDGIRLGLYARRSLADVLERAVDDVFEVTSRCLDTYHDMFGIRMPFGDYDQVFVPDHTAAAMENAGCVTFDEDFLYRGAVTAAELENRAGTIAHELAHQWFGDLVTMRWWEDLWLNESFAEFLAHHVRMQHTARDPWVDFGITRKQWGITADAGPTSHPVAANVTPDTIAALQNFDGISYAKGAAVLRELVEHMGEERFLTGLRQYFDAHAYGNAELADLLDAWREAGVEGIDRWAAVWLTTTGLDRLTATDDAIRREPSADGSVRPHRLTAVSLGQDGEVLGEQDVQIDSATTAIDLPPGLHLPDSCDDAWAQVRPNRPPEQWPSITSVEDVRSQVVLWNSLRAQVRESETSAQTAFDVVLRETPHEPDALILDTLTTWATSELCGVFAPRGERGLRRRRLAAVLTESLQGATEGSDRQLQLLRAVIELTGDVAWLEGLLEGTDVPVGAQVDQTLRWRILRRLARLEASSGQPVVGLLDAELHRDSSSAGVLEYDRAWASRPVAEAKERAFRAIVAPGDLPVSRVIALSAGLFLVEQEELTDELASRWVEEITRTSEFRQGWALSIVASRSFPLANVTPELLGSCRALLDGSALPAALRRTVNDGVHLMGKAVRQIDLQITNSLQNPR